MALAKLLSLEDFISFSLFKKGKGKFNKQTLYRNWGLQGAKIVPK